jgi:hypothetical protein
MNSWIEAEISMVGEHTHPQNQGMHPLNLVENLIHCRALASQHGMPLQHDRRSRSQTAHIEGSARGPAAPAAFPPTPDTPAIDGAQVAPAESA